MPQHFRWRATARLQDNEAAGRFQVTACKSPLASHRFRLTMASTAPTGPSSMESDISAHCGTLAPDAFTMRCGG